MAKIKVNKSKNYTVMSNCHLRDKNLSLKAKGLLSIMLSLPDNWDYSIEGLIAICKESETAVKSTLKELKENGYLTIRKLKPNETQTGRYEYVYDIFEKKQDGEKQEVENQPVEILAVENVGQLNTNILNTNKLNTNNKKESIERKSFKPPTLEEVNAYIQEKNLNVNGKKFYDYFTEGNWIDAKGQKVKNWKQKMLTWNSYGGRETKESQTEKERPYLLDLNQFYSN